MEQNLSSRPPLTLLQQRLCKTIGVIGFFLPVILAVGEELIDGGGIRNSISSYYYSGMRDVFVGSMFSVGFFLLIYRGYDRRDDIAGDIGCVFAVGLALIPTSPDLNPTQHEKLVGDVHLVLAAAFYLTLIYFSLWRFRKTDRIKPPTRQKLRRNLVYTVCGYTMAVALVLIALFKEFLGEAALMRYDPVFWLESVASIAFGLSWLTKGQTVLRDRPERR